MNRLNVWIAMIVLCTACSGSSIGDDNQLQSGGTTSATAPASVSESELPSAEESAASETFRPESPSPQTPGPVSVQPSESSDQPDSIDAFVKANLGEDEEVLLNLQVDLDGDGRQENVLALGQSDWMSQTYVLRQENGTVRKLAEDLAGGGYAIYEIKTVRMKGQSRPYLYCGLTNGAALTGFTLYELSGDSLRQLVSSASATGAGEDELIDEDHDGLMDGYVQNRWSYDVLYVPVSRSFAWKRNQFVFAGAYVEIPDYPDNIQDTIVQYLTLKYLNDDEFSRSESLLKRLNEIASTREVKNKELDWNIWLEALWTGVDPEDFTVQEQGDSADVFLKWHSESGDFGLQFHLTKTKNRWSIDAVK